MIDSPETLKALEYGKELYATFIPGTLSWLDPNNNKAFLDGQICVTNNGISIYYAAKNSTDPKVKEMAADIQHASFPVGPVGVPTESHLFFNQMIMKYTKYPQAAKEFLRFMMEQEQFEPWLTGARRLHLRSRCAAYESNADLDRGSEEHAVPRRGQEHAAGRLCGQAGLRVGGRGGRLHRRQTWWPRRRAARRRRRKRWSAPRSAPNATTRSDAAVVARPSRDRAVATSLNRLGSHPRAVAC